VKPKTIVLPHDRISELIDKEGNFSERLKRSIDLWAAALMNDDGLTHPVSDDGIVLKAQIKAKENGVFVGQKVIEHISNFWAPSLIFKWFFNESSEVSKGDILAEVTGKQLQLLKLERPILNILGRLSGIATSSRRWTCSSQIPIAATRKTTWGLLDKLAVNSGGALTHRLDREDALMIKENDLCANYFNLDQEDRIKYALEDLLIEESSSFVIIEVTNKKQAIMAAKTWKKLDMNQPLTIMLDNIDVINCNEIINTIKNLNLDENLFFEASGGIKFENIDQWNDSLVNVISTSSIHRGTRPLDISLLILEDSNV